MAGQGRAARLALWCLATLSGCLQETPGPPPAPGVVAVVDGVPLEAEALRRFVAGVPRGLRSGSGPAAARREYLRSLMARKLLVGEARARGLDTTARARAEIERRWHRRVIGQYRRERLRRPVTVSDDAIERYFVEHELARERQMWALITDDGALAARLRERLRRGEADFAELARVHSVHRPTAAEGGLVGYVPLPQARRLGVPAEVFRRLPRGVPSEPLPLGKRFLVVRFGPERRRTVEERRGHIEALLAQRRRERAAADHLDSLASALRWRVDPEGLRQLLSLAAETGRLTPNQIPPDAAAHPLFLFAGGQVTLGAYAAVLWLQPFRALSGWGTRDSADVMAAARSTVRRSELLLAGARRSGLLERPAMRRWLRHAEEEVALGELRRAAAVRPARADEAQARRYYDEHREVFRRPEELYLVEALVETRDRGEELRRRVEGGESLTELAPEYTTRPEGRAEWGAIHLGPREELTHPRLYAAAAGAEPGVLTGPVEVGGGYSLFEVMETSPQTIAPFDEVRKKARALARRQQREELFEALVDSLLRAHADRVHVFEQELTAALPDTMLQRLRAEATQ